MKRTIAKYIFLVNILFGCSGDSFKISEVIDGKTVELANGSRVTLTGVDNLADNERILTNYIGKEVFLLDINNDPLVDINVSEENVVVLDENGNNINSLLIGLAQESARSLEENSKEKSANGADPELDIENTSSKNTSLASLYKQLTPSIFLVVANTHNSRLQGSGFFITDNIGVSNFHVFENATSATIQTHDGRVFSVTRTLEENRINDYIVFQVDVEQNIFRPLRLSKTEPEVGDQCFAIGNPKGLENTLSTGIVSQIRESGKWLQITAEITNGSSGGPLFNLEGDVIGITSAGYGEANLNFALNIIKLPISRFQD